MTAPDPKDVEKLARDAVYGGGLPISLEGIVTRVTVALREQGERTWRCFGCGEVFTDESKAAVHFGEDGQPAVCNEWARADAKERRDLYEQALLELSREQEHGMKREAEVRALEAERDTLRADLAAMEAAEQAEAKRGDVVLARLREAEAREATLKGEVVRGVSAMQVVIEAHAMKCRADVIHDHAEFRALKQAVAIFDEALAAQRPPDARPAEPPKPTKDCIYVWGGDPSFCITHQKLQSAHVKVEPVNVRPAEPPADPPKCCCGNPLSLGVVHRLDGPCWIPADDQIPPPSSEGPCPCGRPDRNHTHLREGR